MIVIEFDKSDTKIEYLEDVSAKDICLPFDVIVLASLIAVLDRERGLCKVLKNRYDGDTGILSISQYEQLKSLYVKFHAEK